MLNMTGVKEMVIVLLVGTLAVLSGVTGEARYPPSQSEDGNGYPSHHYIPGMCLSEKSCESCPSDRKATVTKKKFVGWLKYKTVTRTICCPNCGETLKYKQYNEDYTCMCPPVESCWRGDDCDGCDPRYVTKIYGRKICCKNCMAASISLTYNMGMMDTCDCNIPVTDGGDGRGKYTTEVPEIDGSGSVEM